MPEQALLEALGQQAHENELLTELLKLQGDSLSKIDLDKQIEILNTVLEKKTYFDITRESIEAIQAAPSVLLNAQQRQQLRNINKRLLMRASKYTAGVECGECYTLDMKLLKDSVRGGEVSRVKLPDYDWPYISIHNHPDGLTFSVGDINMMLKRPNLKIAIAVGNNGRIYAMEKTAQLDVAGAKALLQELKMKYPRYIEDYWQHTELIGEFLEGAKQYGLYYYTGEN